MKSNIKRTLLFLFTLFTGVALLNAQTTENKLLENNTTKQDNTQINKEKAIPNPAFKTGNDTAKNSRKSRKKKNEENKMYLVNDSLKNKKLSNP